MAPRIDRLVARASHHRLSFNADAAAIALALTLAGLVRLNVIPHISF